MAGKILIVDDDEDLRHSIRSLLENEGYAIFEAIHGQQAVEIFPDVNPDVVLMDVMMPIMNGIDACALIQDLPGGSRTPILMITAVDDNRSAAAAFEVGATDYITKPLEWKLLRHRIRRLVESHRAEEALHQTQAMLKTALAQAPVFMHTIDLDGDFILAEGMDIVVGRPARVGDSFYDTYEHSALHIKDVRRALDGEVFQTMYTAQGIAVQVWYAPLLDSRERITGAMMVGTDVSDESWKQDAFMESQRAMQTLLANLPGMAYRSRHEPEWEFEFVSDGCRDITGYSPADLIGNHAINFLDLVHPDDLEPMWAEVRQAVAEKRSFQVTYRIQTADGRERGLWEQGQAVGDSDDLIVEGFITDITERRRAERDLIQERNLLRTLIDNLPDYVFVKDRDGRFIVTNIANMRYLRQNRPQEVIGRTDFDFFPPERAEAYRQRDLEVMEAGDMIWEQVQEDHFHYHITKAPLRNASDDVVGVVGMIRDVTRQKQAEEEMRLVNEQLVELSSLKSHFLLTMSHELRTPLGAIIGYTDLLRQGILGDINDKQLDRLNRIAANSEQLLAIISDILDISKIQTGQMEVSLRPVDVSSLARECYNGFLSLTENKGLHFAHDIEPALPAVIGDAAAVMKILTNLVSNAIKFTPSGGSIRLTVQYATTEHLKSIPADIDVRKRDWLLVEVEDTGIGIAPDDQKMLFNEFRQIDTDPTRKHGGTGLGLALTHKLVGMMHGHLWLESSLGQGSVFSFILPVVD
jgi:PAS domain S-box-containing protein